MLYTLINDDWTEETREGKISPFISDREASCSHCGKTKVYEPMVLLFNEARQAYGKPIVINSFYRCPEYQKQLQKSNPNAALISPHVYGVAMDLAIPRDLTIYQLIDLFLQAAKDLGLPKPRIGHKQYNNAFLHVDLAFMVDPNPAPWAWKPGVTW
jgi:zinc D-Ala-D-Ala carboxypeptidase